MMKTRVSPWKSAALTLASVALLLCSCDISNEDYVRIYNHAKSGDIDATYRIVQLTEGNDTILPKDTLNAFKDTLLQRGPFEYYWYCYWKDRKENAPKGKSVYEVSTPEFLEKHNKFLEDTGKKWWGLGVENGIRECFYKLYVVTYNEYKKSKSEADSLELVKYLDLCRENKAYEADIFNAKESGQPFNWIKAELRYLIPIWYRNINDMGLCHGTFYTVFYQMSQFPANFCVKYLISRHWWKALLFFLFSFALCVAMYIVPVFIPIKKADIGKPFTYGTFLAISHCVLYFFSINQKNYLWGKTVFSLWYPSYSFGISPYIPIGINWLVIGIMVYFIWKDIKKSEGSWLAIVLLHLGVFVYTYLVITALGLMCFIILFVFAALKASGKTVQDIAKNGLQINWDQKSDFKGGYRDVDGLGTMHEIEPGVWADASGSKYNEIPEEGMIKGPGGNYKIKD